MEDTCIDDEMNQPLLLCEECHTPLPFILTGYRPTMSIKNTICSLFTCHNETCNIWTHLIPFFISVGLIIVEYSNTIRPIYDTYVIVTYCVCMAFCFFTSTLYHLICNNKEWGEVFLKLDYISILVLIWGV